MIKFALRRNLIYPFQYLLWNVIRDIERDLIRYFFGLKDLTITTPLMFLEEFLAGLIFHLHQKKNISKNKNGNDTNSSAFQFIQAKYKIIKGNRIKIIFFIFTIALYDFVQFFLAFPLSKFINLSESLAERLKGTYTIITAIFSYYKLGLPIFKHQYFSLIVIIYV